jgi:choline dehydrogenase-like flavoprotein
MFGGSSNRWGGWCRPLGEEDYQVREWLAHSGWPISAQTLRPYEADAARLFELPHDRFDLSAWCDRLPPPLPLGATNFENIVFQHSPETNFAEKYGARLFEANNVTTMLYANLTQMRLDRGSNRVGEVDVATLTGRRFRVRSKAVVLAAGGIENARLLLASQADRPAGLGNEFDLVGRYFMEHLHMPVGHLIAAPGTVSNGFYGKAIFEDARLRGVIIPSAAAQERYRMLATSIAVEGASYALGTPFVGWPPRVTFGPVSLYRALRSSRFKRGAEVIKQIAQRLQSVPARIETWNQSRLARSRANGADRSGRIYSLYFRGEQAPDPANRIRLSQTCDALGVPRSRLEWRVGALDAASITGWLELLDRDMRARNIGAVVGPLEDWQGGVTGGPHHMGTTRMSADPRHGVVDADCRVHSLENLYVAGSSVFATSGYVNPTFTLVTLALRLADTLGKRLRN